MEQQKQKNNEVDHAILCLDLGTKMGWALQSPNGVVTSGTANFTPSRWEGNGMRFIKFNQFLNELNHDNSIKYVFFEKVERHLGTYAAHIYGGFWSHLTAWCDSREVIYDGVTVGDIKEFYLGKRRASKEQIKQAVAELGYSPCDDNESDALALLHWVIANRKLGNA